MTEDQKRIMRENRIGKIRVVHETFSNEPWINAARAVLFEAMMVIDRETADDHHIWLKGYSAQFEAQPLGRAMPEYVATITQHGPDVCTIAFHLAPLMLRLEA